MRLMISCLLGLLVACGDKEAEDTAVEEIKAGLKTKDWVKILVDQWKNAKAQETA